VADKIVKANTFSFKPGAVYATPTRQAYAKTLASSISHKMEGKNSMQIRHFDVQARRVGKNIEVTNLSDNKPLATIYPNNTIAMNRALSQQQVQALEGFQSHVAAAEKAAAKNIKRDGPSLGLG
jgi:hypothetical protein